ncbi:MAG: efflux RND transporter periplasmic adaptor subunit [Roseimicrobium sp.]
MARLPHFLALAGAGFLFVSCERHGAATAAPPGTPTVTVAKPIVKRIMEWDEYVGRLVSPKTVELRARVSGYLEKVHFKQGSEVKQGDILFTIDPRPYQAIVDRLQAELERTKTHAELATSEAKRAQSLVASKAISAEDFEQKAKMQSEALASVRAAEAGVAVARLDLEFTEVRAPIAGRVSDARVTEGNLVIGGNTATATMLTTIVAVDPIYCFMDVDERSSLKYRQLYREGKRGSALFQEVPAEMGLANEEGFPHKGVVDFVDNQVSPDTGTIRSRSVFPNKDHLMSPGYFARVRVPGSGEYDGLLVRDSAIGSDQGRPYVFVVDADGVAHFRSIVTGPLEEGLRVVKEGLKADERIVVNGVIAVKNGAKVIAEEEPMK